MGGGQKKLKTHISLAHHISLLKFKGNIPDIFSYCPDLDHVCAPQVTMHEFTNQPGLAGVSSLMKEPRVDTTGVN